MRKRRVMWFALAAVAVAMSVQGEAGVVREKEKHTVMRDEGVAKVTEPKAPEVDMAQIECNERATLIRLGALSSGKAIFGKNTYSKIADGYGFVAHTLSVAGGGQVGTSINLAEELPMDKIWFAMAIPKENGVTGRVAFAVLNRPGQGVSVYQNESRGYKVTAVSCHCECFVETAKIIARGEDLDGKDCVHGSAPWKRLTTSAASLLMQ